MREGCWDLTVWSLQHGPLLPQICKDALIYANALASESQVSSSEYLAHSMYLINDRLL